MMVMACIVVSDSVKIKKCKNVKMHCIVCYGESDSIFLENYQFLFLCFSSIRLLHSTMYIVIGCIVF